MAPGDQSSGFTPLTLPPRPPRPAYLLVERHVGTLGDFIGVSIVPHHHQRRPLYDGTAGGLGITISDGATTYMSGQTVNSLPLANDGTVDDLLVSTTADPGGTSTKHVSTIGYSLPLGAQNEYQGGSAS